MEKIALIRHDEINQQQYELIEAESIPHFATLLLALSVHENSVLKSQLEELSKKYQSLQLRLTDTLNQLARSVHG